MRISDWSSDVCSSDLGATTGLAWTEVGGELLTVEAVTVPGKGTIRATGKLGDVMQESIQAAFSFVKARAPAHGLKPSLLARKDVHEIGRASCRVRVCEYV